MTSLTACFQLFSDEITDPYNWKGNRRKDLYLAKGLRYHGKSRDLPCGRVSGYAVIASSTADLIIPLGSTQNQLDPQRRLVRGSVTPFGYVIMAERAHAV